jgi:hypothetical protein
VLLAVRGSRNLGSGEKLIDDPKTRSELRNKARRIQIAALIAGLLLAGLAHVITT